MLFESIDLIEPIQKALKAEGYITATPIQEQTIPILLQGKDLVGCAQTGTGKTAAYSIPILQTIYGEQRYEKGHKDIKALVLAPTRELAIQIGESFTAYGKYTGVRNTVVFGGVAQQAQVHALRAGVDVLVATPGRLLDLINQKYIDLSNVKFFVLDESDRMLDMGMVQDVKRIIAKLPKVRQTMLFSATMPKEIAKLADSILINPVKIAVTPVASTIDLVDQEIYFVDKRNKKALLIHLLEDKNIVSALVFSRTKHGANKITEALEKVGITSQAIHGNKSQSARQLALSNFKEGKTRVLVATDIAARGIDINELSHVINFDLPEVPETYVHRIGRTGRAGLGGVALSFCDEEEKEWLRGIQKLIDKTIPIIEDHPYPMSATEHVVNKDTRKKNSTGRPRSNGYFRKNTNVKRVAPKSKVY